MKGTILGSLAVTKQFHPLPPKMQEDCISQQSLPLGGDMRQGPSNTAWNRGSQTLSVTTLVTRIVFRTFKVAN